MKVGVTLPQFRDEADTALSAARRAEALGIDGVFVFDHLWPMGHPGRPALSSGPLLGALAASTTTIHLGTLVAGSACSPTRSSSTCCAGSTHSAGAAWWPASARATA